MYGKRATPYEVLSQFSRAGQHAPRLLGTLVGLADLIVGVAIIKMSRRLARGLNTMYAALPGAFRASRGSSVTCAFGGVVAILSVIFGPA